MLNVALCEAEKNIALDQWNRTSPNIMSQFLYLIVLFCNLISHTLTLTCKKQFINHGTNKKCSQHFCPLPSLWSMLLHSLHARFHQLNSRWKSTSYWTDVGPVEELVIMKSPLLITSHQTSKNCYFCRSDWSNGRR